ncbi:MAG: AI-2E family transporter [Thermomicrobiales bacterium]
MVDGPEGRIPPALKQALPIYYALLLAILTVLGLMILIRLQHVLLILFVSILFAATLSQPAEFLTRFRIPRLVAVIMIYLFAAGAIVLLGWLVVFPILTEISDLGTEFPEYADRLEGARKAYEELSQQYPQLESFDQEFSDIGERISNSAGDMLIGLPTRIARLAFDALSVFFISILLVTNRERIRDLTLSMIHPHHRDLWQDVLTKIWNRLGYFLRAKAIVMVIVGALAYVGLLFLGVRFPFLLAVIVAAGQIIPRIGPWFARIPLLGIAALDGLNMVIYVSVLSVFIENLKGYIIAPIIEGDQLNIHPLLVFISVLIGGSLLGIGGAFIAVPAAAAVQVVFEEVVVPWRTGHFDMHEDGEPAGAIGVDEPASGTPSE